MTVTITVRRVANGQYQAVIQAIAARLNSSEPYSDITIYETAYYHGRGAKAKARAAAQAWCRENGHEVRKQ